MKFYEVVQLLFNYELSDFFLRDLVVEIFVQNVHQIFDGFQRDLLDSLPPMVIFVRNRRFSEGRQTLFGVGKSVQVRGLSFRHHFVGS